MASPNHEKPPLLESHLFKKYSCIAFVDDEGTVVGLGLGGPPRPDVAAHLGRSRDDYGWSGYINGDVGSKDLTPRKIYAAVHDVASTQWIRMSSSWNFNE